ncbi:MAG TPA: SDR family NAD(P)-dependent oxidoreductase [Allosphingosinicella sp.]|nr:SDR family NAD(P)-dependent oxidoreductase [Allosphingosinicella sp.]
MTGFLETRLALVTGASRGVGAAVAEALAREGAHVVLTARDADALEAVEGRIHAAGGSATIAPLDLTEPGGAAKLAQAVAGRWHALDILVLGAAPAGSATPVAELGGAAFNAVLTLNLVARQAMIAAFDPLLRRSLGASLIAIAAHGGGGAEAAARAALETLLLSYAAETANVSAVKVALADAGDGGEAAAGAIVGLLRSGFETGHRLVLP